MATQVSISNIALARIGVNRSISSLDEDSQEAVICRLFFDQLRDEVLRDAAWPFATRYATLALVEEEPNEDWMFAYRAPSDLIRAIRIIGDVRQEWPRVPFKIGSDDAGLLVYCDYAEARLEYTARITDPTRFAPDFASALAWRMAMEIGTPLAENPAMADRAARYYAAAMASASTNAANEQVGDQRDAESIAVRG